MPSREAVVGGLEEFDGDVDMHTEPTDLGSDSQN
jgi:hypothetical protein